MVTVVSEAVVLCERTEVEIVTVLDGKGFEDFDGCVAWVD
jgi:hypothetical protein